MYPYYGHTVRLLALPQGSLVGLRLSAWVCPLSCGSELPLQVVVVGGWKGETIATKVSST